MRTGDEEEEMEEEARAARRSHFFDATPDLDDEDEDDGGPRRFPKKTVWTIVGIIVLIAIGAYVTSVFFDHADITINFKQTPWSYQSNFTASKSAVGINPANNTIPAQMFTTTKNVTESFPGSPVQQVSQKAQGTITIYNAYSAAPQDLVATTRFLTPDGKIFRITTNVTVPGETKAPTARSRRRPSPRRSSPTRPARTTTSAPSQSSPSPDLITTPAREAGFYGVITASTTGGFIGQRATPTAADIANAKASTTAILEASAAERFLRHVSEQL